MSTLRLTTISNQTGSSSVPSETVINGSAKAWVNFNGTGTVAIRASFNVSSITDNGVGDYTVNFTTAMVDANYAVVCTRQVGTNSIYSRIFGQNGNTNPAAGSVRTYSFYNGSGADAAEDIAYAFVAVFR